MSNLVELSTRQKYRYPCQDVSLTVEDLFSLPLTGNHGYNLDTVAITLDNMIHNNISFVEQKNDTLETMLSVVQYIIQVTKDEAEEERIEQEKQLMINQLLELKRSKELESLTLDEINNQLKSVADYE